MVAGVVKDLGVIEKTRHTGTWSERVTAWPNSGKVRASWAMISSEIRTSSKFFARRPQWPM